MILLDYLDNWILFGCFKKSRTIFVTFDFSLRRFVCFCLSGGLCVWMYKLQGPVVSFLKSISESGGLWVYRIWQGPFLPIFETWIEIFKQRVGGLWVHNSNLIFFKFSHSLTNRLSFQSFGDFCLSVIRLVLEFVMSFSLVILLLFQIYLSAYFFFPIGRDRRCE